jgi:hypothetical protein
VADGRLRDFGAVNLERVGAALAEFALLSVIDELSREQWTLPNDVANESDDP